MVNICKNCTDPIPWVSSCPEDVGANPFIGPCVYNTDLACQPYACDAFYDAIIEIAPWGYWPMDDAPTGAPGNSAPVGGVAAARLGVADFDATQGTGATAGHASLMPDTCVGVTAMDIDGSSLHWPNGDFAHSDRVISIASVVKPTNSLAAVTVVYRYDPLGGISTADFQVKILPGSVSLVYRSESGDGSKNLIIANASIAPIGTDRLIIVSCDDTGFDAWQNDTYLGRANFESGEDPVAYAGPIGATFKPSFIISGDKVQHVVVNLEPWTADEVAAIQLSYARNDSTYVIPEECWATSANPWDDSCIEDVGVNDWLLLSDPCDPIIPLIYCDRIKALSEHGILAYWVMDDPVGTGQATDATGTFHHLDAIPSGNVQLMEQPPLVDSGVECVYSWDSNHVGVGRWQTNPSWWGALYDDSTTFSFLYKRFGGGDFNILNKIWKTPNSTVTLSTTGGGTDLRIITSSPGGAPFETFEEWPGIFSDQLGETIHQLIFRFDAGDGIQPLKYQLWLDNVKVIDYISASAFNSGAGTPDSFGIFNMSHVDYRINTQHVWLLQGLLPISEVQELYDNFIANKFP